MGYPEKGKIYSRRFGQILPYIVWKDGPASKVLKRSTPRQKVTNINTGDLMLTLDSLQGNADDNWWIKVLIVDKIGWVCVEKVKIFEYLIEVKE